jgi:DNA-binding NarL/FixJ family response regulator
MPNSVRISIIDDDERVRAQLARAISRFPGCKLHSQHHTGAYALAVLPENPPDVTLVDISMPEMDGVECVRQLKPKLPQVEFLMLTICEDTETVFKALSAGASGYVLKRAAREELREAIFQVRAGGSPMTSHIARLVVQSFRRPDTSESSGAALSPREQEVLDLLSQGHLYKEIAASLGISYETVHNHIRRIYEKLQVRSRSQAVAKYFGTRAGRP